MGRIRLFDHLWLAINSTGIQGVLQFQSAMFQSALGDAKKGQKYLCICQQIHSKLVKLLTSKFVCVQTLFIPGNWEKFGVKSFYSHNNFPSKIKIIIFTKKMQLRIN